MTTQTYVGSELDLFARATCWKTYFGNIIRPFLAGEALEVGAGIGATTPFVCPESVTRWTCLEPDPDLHRKLAGRIAAGLMPRSCVAALGTLPDLPESARFDAILYLDVLEHIEGDAEQAELAMGRLNPGGHLVVLAPSHQWLFTPFDAAVGHHRRYTKKTLQAAIPRGLREVRLDYLDSVGLLASLANRMLLKQSMPTEKQIRFWDRVLVPMSRVVDTLTFRLVGKSVLGIWRKP